MALEETREKIGDRTPPRGLGGSRARLSVDDPATSFLSALTAYNYPEHDQDWRLLELDDQTFDRINPSELVERLADLSPEVSRAIWDFLRFTNAGWELDCFRPNTETTDDRAKAVLEAFLTRLSDLYGSVDVVINRLFLAAFLRGSLFAELVFDPAGREAVDVATPDPRHVQFEQRQDPVRGSVYVPFQWQRGRRVYLDSEFVRYVPVDPLPGSPFGRALATPAIFTCLFSISLLRDLRRVVAQQGYPRLDIEIITEQLWAWAQKAGIDADPDALKAFVASVVSEVKREYAQLAPDDAFVHTDVTRLNRPVGTIDSSSLGAVEGLMRSLERSMVRALKSMPFLFGSNETTTETQANRQYEAHLAGIKAVQHLAEGLWEYFLRLALQAQGMVADVRFRFAEVRAAELLRDAQVEKQQIDNAMAKLLAGWIDQTAAAEEGAGAEEPALPEPLFVPQGYTPFAPAPAEPAGVAAETGQEEELEDEDEETPEEERLRRSAQEIATYHLVDHVARMFRTAIVHRFDHPDDLALYALVLNQVRQLPVGPVKRRLLARLKEVRRLIALPGEEAEEQERIQRLLARIRSLALPGYGPHQVALERIEAGLRSLHRRETFTPADTDLPPLDDTQAEVEDADISRSLTVWDEEMPSYRGMLDAEVVGG